MEALFADVNWLAVGVSTIISFILSGLWYSPKMFGTKWAKGVGVNVDADAKQPMPALVTQFIGTLLFAWVVAKYVKSNAIVYAKDSRTVGVGAGQMSRVYSAKVAGIKAADEGLQVAGSVMASDAFFPFRDGIDSAAEVGITAVIQPGGSVRDEEVIAAADEANMVMMFTGMRHFRH